MKADGFSIALESGWQEQAPGDNLVRLARSTASGAKQMFTVSRLSDEIPTNIYADVGCSQWRQTILEKSRHVSKAAHRIVQGAFGAGCEVATIGGDRMVLVTVIPSAMGLPYSALCSGPVKDMKEMVSACDAVIASWRGEMGATSDGLSFTPLAEAKRISGPGFSLEVPAGWALQSTMESGTHLLAIRGTTAEKVRVLKVFTMADAYASKSDEECRALGAKVDGIARSIPTYDGEACEVVTDERDIVTLVTMQPDKNGKLLGVRCAGPLSEAKALIRDCHEIAKTLRLE